MLNGLSLSRSTFEKHCYYVEQYDEHWHHLTVKETLIFAAKFSQVISNDEISREVVGVLRKVSLKSVQNEYCSVLSGGQQRRLSLAIALLKKPSILILDELTSGLDSAASQKVCEILKDIAVTKKIIVICTIHQPSTKVFNCFDQMMIISGGRLAYAGSTVDAENYFASIDHQLPLHTNPAEYYLDLVDSNFGQEHEVQKILDFWTLKNECTDLVPPPSRYDEISERYLTEPEKSQDEFDNCYDSFKDVFNRHFLLILRDVS